jgi:asparagine synthase (glutamine-hydrolysing)
VPPGAFFALRNRSATIETDFDGPDARATDVAPWRAVTEERLPMCGIAGILRLDGGRLDEQSTLTAMTESLAHRGPDDRGYHLEGPVGLGHRRLSILDLSGGHQPWLDESLGRALVYNGEIYNYRELRREEESRGAAFRTTCDTEVLFRIADTERSEWLARLNGMFAFALWDRAADALLLVRDRIGIKPLYYTYDDGRLLFASEIKALLAAGVPRELDRAAIAEYVAFRNLCGSRTLFSGVFELPPGHLLRVRVGRSSGRVERYWTPQPATPGTYTDPGAPLDTQFATLFGSAVDYRLIADVPLGTYNSGGVDSSLISAYVRQRTTGTLHTFSVGFEEESHDESRYAQIVADRLGTTHHLVTISGRDYAAALETAIRQADAPLFQAHTIQLFRLSALAREFVTVVLTGEGADELFAGYPRYQIPLLAARLRVLPAIFHRGLLAVFRALGKRRLSKLFELSRSSGRAVIENARFCPENHLASVGLADAGWPARESLWQDVRRKELPELEAILDYDRQSYMIGLLERLDRTTMASGLEARVPFLDHRLVEWSMGLPARAKVEIGRRNKILVKEAAAQIFPHEMIYRRKVGFGVPLDAWFRRDDSLGGYLELISDRTFGERELFDPSRVLKIVDDHRRGAGDYGDLLWGLVNLELWIRTTLDGAQRRRIGAQQR